MRIIVLTILILLSVQAFSQKKSYKINNDDNTLLWEISGKGLKKPSFIFGTMHMVCKEDVNFSENLKNALADADTVYFEMDLDDPTLMLSGMKFMKMKDKTLKDLYTPEEFDRVEKYFNDSIKVPFKMMQSLKPLFLQALIYPKLMPCKNVSSVEQELMLIAKKQSKPIKGLETLEFQASVFDSIPYDVQARDLLKSIDSFGSYNIQFQKMVNDYKNQDFSNYDSLLKSSEYGSEENQAVLLDNRNINWAKQLNLILKGKPVFVAVGAAHLPGKNGIINLLRQQGYTLKPLYNK